MCECGEPYTSMLGVVFMSINNVKGIIHVRHFFND